MGELETAIAIYAVIGVCTLVYGLLRSRMLHWRRRGVPYEEPQFLVGNVRDVGVSRHLYEPVGEAYDKFKGTGPFCGFFAKIKPVAIVLDLELAKNILIRDFDSFNERGVYHNAQDDPLTGNLFTLDGSEWMKLRSKLAPTFSAGKMKQMFPLVANVAKECREVLQDMIIESPQVDVHDLVARFITDALGTCAFGLNCHSLREPEAELLAAHRNMRKKQKDFAFVHTFNDLFQKLAKRLRMCEMMRATESFYFRIVSESMDHREKNNIKRDDLLNSMIEMKKSADPNARLTVDEITANAFIYFVAGFEPSSACVTFALYELASHQAIQKKLRQEIGDVLQKHGGEITYESLQEMKYLDQVISETLRKYPAYPQLQRRAQCDYPTDTPGYVIQKNTVVFIPVHAIQHDPDIYPDPEKFKPERFEPEELLKRNSLAWLAFGGEGPRNCIGLQLGKMLVRLALITLLKDYIYSVCPQTTKPMKFNVQLPLLTPGNEVFLKVTRA